MQEGSERQIKRIRILPPMGIARFGSSPEPMENYELTLPDQNGSDPCGYRTIHPAKTFYINPLDGSIDKYAEPDAVYFRDTAGRIKPICPFFEVWVQFEGSDEFTPLRIQHLERCDGIKLKWRVRAGNLKPYRRTGDPRDKVQADTRSFGDHHRHELVGRSKNFKPGKYIAFGHFQFIKPRRDNDPDTDAVTSMIRVRFTPGAGLVFGPRKDDPNISDDVYWGQTSGDEAFGGMKAPGRWDRYIFLPDGDPPYTAAADVIPPAEGWNLPPHTGPADILQGEWIGVQPVTILGSGYLDDTCDGIVEVVLTKEGKAIEADGMSLRAYARFSGGVPDFAPDCLPVRSIYDDLEQIVLGPEIKNDEDPQRISRRAEDTLRRALETARQMNLVAMNGDQNIGGIKENNRNMPWREKMTGRKFEPVYSEDSDYGYAYTEAKHETLLKNAIRGEWDPKIKSKLRDPKDVGKLDNDSRRRIPAMMRGSEGLELVLTYRQLNQLNYAISASTKATAVLEEDVSVASTDVGAAKAERCSKTERATATAK